MAKFVCKIAYILRYGGRVSREPGNSAHSCQCPMDPHKEVVLVEVVLFVRSEYVAGHVRPHKEVVGDMDDHAFQQKYLLTILHVWHGELKDKQFTHIVCTTSLSQEIKQLFAL